jgi:hypothetical protein
MLFARAAKLSGMDASDNYAAETSFPARNEHDFLADYLAQRIKELEQAQRGWKAWILAAAAGATFLFLLTGGLMLLRAKGQARMAQFKARIRTRWLAKEEQSEQARHQLEAGKQSR